MKAALYQFRSVILLAILCFAFFTRMYNLNNPEKYLFDEVYHAVTAKLIAQDDPRAYEWWNPAPEPDTAVDWLHPPLAKYFQAVSILAFGENSFGWRFSSVVFGVLVILITYHLAYRIFHNHIIALISAALASLDGLLLVQSRIAMNDIHVTFFILFTLYNYQVYRQTNKTSKLFLTGLSAGLAMASKWSGLFSLAIVCFFELFHFIEYFFTNTTPKMRKYANKTVAIVKWLAVRALFLIILPIFIYVASYSQMFIQGKGWAHFKELHNQIWWYQTTLSAEHPYQSRPFEWFLNLRPVWMNVEYSNPAGVNMRADIYAFGNPVLFFIGAAIVFATLIYFWLRAADYFENREKNRTQKNSAIQDIFGKIVHVLNTNQLVFLFLSYVLIWLPWQLSPRIMFFYHYTPAVPLLCILISYWAYLWGRHQKGVLFLLFATIAAAFVIWYPHWVGIPVSSEWADTIYFAIPQWK